MDSEVCACPFKNISQKVHNSTFHGPELTHMPKPSGKGDWEMYHFRLP